AAIAGGAGAGGDMKAVLATRMNAGNPPDSFQVHLGKELTEGYAKADKMEDLNALFASEGWDKTFPKGLLDAAASGGKQFSVPVNIHRSNVMWFNKKIMADNGIDKAPTTFDEWFAMAEKLKAKGVPALAMGASSAGPDAHLFENILAGSLGADAYSKLWTASASWSDPKVTAALETFKKMIGYANKDYLQIVGWDAGDYIISGKAASYIMGDWMNGFYKAKKFADLGYAPSPGTQGIFVALSDSFGLPKKAPNRDASLAWLKVCGSVAGQDAFNPVKGSIPARTDAGKSSDYDAYQKAAMMDWTKDKIVPSLVHGFAAKQSWVTDWQNAINGFATKLDVKATQDTLVKIAKDAIG
ncbi:MAG: extracellular solute-binding protein, partial [Proteobacteria bacterium]|nr:extracellular solute-binding protein [Pseudomonadota bacterium]